MHVMIYYIDITLVCFPVIALWLKYKETKNSKNTTSF